MIKNVKKCFLKVFDYVKKFKFLKIREIVFFFVFKCKQKEHVHNLNRRWARSALNPKYLINKEGAFILDKKKLSRIPL